MRKSSLIMRLLRQAQSRPVSGTSSGKSGSRSAPWRGRMATSCSPDASGRPGSARSRPWRWISPLIAVGGLAVVAIGIAASPVSAFGSNYSGAVGPVLWAAVAGYALHRDSDHERAPLWALAFGVTAAVILVVTLGMAVVIRPTVLGIPGLGDAWAGLIVSGFLVMFVGAFLWERDARTRRFAALALLAVWPWSAGSSRR